jgi:hypothetical protein
MATPDTVPEYGTHALAGRYAQAWYEKLELRHRHGSRAERSELIDTILDDALADAGVLPREVEFSITLDGEFDRKV